MTSSIVCIIVGALLIINSAVMKSRDKKVEKR